jgi:Protein of unknown function (DUF3987)
LVGIIGSIQNTVLSTAISKQSGNGLLARFLFCGWEPPPSEYNENHAGVGDERAHLAAIRRILDLEMDVDSRGEQCPHIIKYTKEAMARHGEFVREVDRLKGHDDLYGDWVRKTPGFVARLSLALATLEWACGPEYYRLPREINTGHVESAIRLIDEIYEPTMKRLTDASETAGGDSLKGKVIAYVKKKGPVSENAISHSVRLPTGKLPMLVKELVKDGSLIPKKYVPSNGGRPTIRCTVA